MTSLNVEDLVEHHLGRGWLRMVLDVAESRPRWRPVYWHTPLNICINPLLENELFLTLSVEDASRDADARAVPGRGAP